MEITDFKIQIENFYGPLDLLLFLLREDELTITEIPISRITDQFISYIEVMKRFDISLSSDFMAMAALLIEMKSKELLPKEELTEEDECARIELVRKLLEYKKYKELAKKLSSLIDYHQKRIPKTIFELPKEMPEEEPVIELNLWKLCSSYAKISKEISLDYPIQILYVDIPIEKVMNELLSALRDKGDLYFHNFVQDKDKNFVITSFLATLELSKQELIKLEQEKDYSDIKIILSPKNEMNVSMN